MYEYEMDPTKTVGATEWTQDAGRTDGRRDRRMDGRTDGWMEWNQYTPQTTSLCVGYKKAHINDLMENCGISIAD